MELLQARRAVMALLEEKLHLSENRTLFAGAIPVGIPEGIAFRISGIRAWHPAQAVECEAEIHGIYADETCLHTQLAILRELFACKGESGLLSWQLAGTVKLEFLPGENQDRYSFTLPLVLSFV